MKIVLLGYGKMGKEIERLALDNGHEIVAKVDRLEDWKTFEVGIKRADVAIEFSTPQSVEKNIYRCFELNLPVIVGTTGWNDKAEAIKTYCIEHNQTLFYASNFSIGVNIFFELNRHLAKMMSGQDDYKVRMQEVHHLEKLDKPSGTAISLAEEIIRQIPQKTHWTLDNVWDDKHIPITSVREAAVLGVHQVLYESDNDFIEIKHHAKSRKGFANGALKAAEWILGKKGVYTMSDLLNSQKK